MFKASRAQLKIDATAAAMELVGTVLFLLLGLGGIQAAAYSNTLTAKASQNGSLSGPQAINSVAGIDQLLYISCSMGFALLTSAWLFFRVTGGVFNPQVALALLLTGCISPIRFSFYIVAQIVGSIIASALLKAILPGPLFVNVALGPNVSAVQGLFIEAIGTAALVFAVLMLAAEKHKSTAIAPIGIGLTLFACHLFAVLFTGAALNSARALGPAVFSGFPTIHWIYWVGPTLGSLFSTALYSALKQLKYQNLNPNQDSHYEQHSGSSVSETLKRFSIASNTSLERPSFASATVEVTRETRTDSQIPPNAMV
ncbi:aquaporin-like protein [Sistotremastrum suecicum HHB10207 ss-3]|nr:aquaporin-like protein [Sistotremastrum suecicum HHB10207 ss-3]